MIWVRSIVARSSARLAAAFSSAAVAIAASTYDFAGSWLLPAAQLAALLAAILDVSDPFDHLIIAPRSQRKVPIVELERVLAVPEIQVEKYP